MSSVTVERIGRRSYLRGLPFDARHVAKSAGCKWDPDARAWYSGKADVAATVAAKVQSSPASAGGEKPKTDRPAPGADATVAGRAVYKGKTYYIAGRLDRGRTHWDDRVDAVTTRDGQKFLLYFRDGSSSFWAAIAAVQVTKTYDRPKTIAGLQRFAERAKREGFSGGGAAEYCYHNCPVGGFRCCPENGQCHDCE